MQRQASRQPLREQVLDAVERVVREKGAAHLTLDAVASEADVSKGGMLYHFRSKDALLAGLLGRTTQRVRARVEAIVRNLPRDTPHVVARAELLAITEDEPADPMVGLSLLAATAHDPELAASVRQELSNTLRAVAEIEEGVPTARLMYLAMIGLYILDILKLLPFSPKEKAHLRAVARKELEKNWA